MPASSSTPPKPEQPLKGQIQRLSETLPGALAGHEESVHQMRVACRRLRVALPLLSRRERARTMRRCRTALRLLIRTAGRTRDLDVIWALYAREAAASERRGGPWSILRRRLRDARRRSHRRLAQDLLDLDLARLRRDLRSLLTRSVEDDLEAVCARLAARFERERERCLHAFESLGRRLDFDALHALRRRIRRLRYLAELREGLDRVEPGTPSSLRDLQDRLGRLRDTALLARWLDEQASHSRRRGARALARAAASHAAVFRTVIERLHAEFFNQEPLRIVSTSAGPRVPEGSLSASCEDRGARGRVDPDAALVGRLTPQERPFHARSDRPARPSRASGRARRARRGTSPDSRG